MLKVPPIRVHTRIYIVCKCKTSVIISEVQVEVDSDVFSVGFVTTATKPTAAIEKGKQLSSRYPIDIGLQSTIELLQRICCPPRGKNDVCRIPRACTKLYRSMWLSWRYRWYPISLCPLTRGSSIRGHAALKRRVLRAQRCLRQADRVMVG